MSAILPDMVWPKLALVLISDAGLKRAARGSWKCMTQLEMWANAHSDGRPAERRWRPLFNAQSLADAHYYAVQ